MNNKIEVFKNEQFGEVRTILEGETLLFCGSDIAKALGYARPGKAIIDHCKGVLKRDTLTSGGMQSLSYIPEGDVYRLIVHSKLPAAEKFEHWLFDEVVPTIRKTGGDLAAGASLVVKEKIMTTGDQHAVTDFNVDLNGEGCSANIVSRSVAKDVSKQEFISHINGNCACAGHSECDAIIMDNASVIASPAPTANSVDASLIHEAAIGKIAGEQLIKLMTLGLTEKEAEDQIVNGFFK